MKNKLYAKLMDIFTQGSERFVNEETELILSGVSERCLCGAFMLKIRQKIDGSEFENYYVDIEYNRNYDGRIKSKIDEKMEVIDITCDLIIHSRGTIPNQDNLISFEMKRDTHKEDEKAKDRIRLKALTRTTYDSRNYSADGTTLPEYVCGYIIGVFYEISIKKREINIEYYYEGNLKSTFTKRF